MKKIAFAMLLVGSVALAGDILSAQFTQIGNGANGMTSAAPALATDGIAVQKSDPANVHCNATQALLHIQNQVGAFAQVQQGVERGWIYTISPDGGSASNPPALDWAQAPQLDCFVDGGSVAAKGNKDLTCGPIAIPMGLPAGARVAWSAEQIQQATTLDAGVNLGVVLFAPTVCP